MLILFSAYQVSNGRDQAHLPEFLMINPRMGNFILIFFFFCENGFD